MEPETTIETQEPQTTTQETVQDTQEPVQETVQDSEHVDEAQEQDEQQAEQQPQPFKIGDDEYTPEQLQEIINRDKESKKQQEVQAPKLIPTEEIDANYNKTKEEFTSDFKLLSKHFIALAEPPVVNDQYDTQAPVNAFYEGSQTGNFDEFIKYLSPQDAIRFEKQKQKLFDDYNSKFKEFDNQRQWHKIHAEVKETVEAFDGYARENIKDNPALEKAFEFMKLDYAKKGMKFDKESADGFVKAFLGMQAQNASQQMQEAQTNMAKEAMMATMPQNQKPQTSTKVFTRAEIAKMSPSQYKKNEKAIFDQTAKGLIK